MLLCSANRKLTLNLVLLSGPGSTDRKISEEARWEGVWVREAQTMDYYTPEMYQILQQCLLGMSSNLRSGCGRMSYRVQGGLVTIQLFTEMISSAGICQDSFWYYLHTGIMPHFLLLLLLAPQLVSLIELASYCKGFGGRWDGTWALKWVNFLLLSFF